MAPRFGRAVRRLALASVVPVVAVVAVLFVAGSMTQPPGEMASVGLSGLETVYRRLDLGLHALASGGWIVLVGLGVGVATAIVIGRRRIDPPTVGSALLEPQQRESASRVVTRIAEDELYDWFVVVFRGYATVIATVWVGVVVLVAAAVVVGPAAPSADAPSVSPEEPTPEVAADAVENISTRSHVSEYRYAWLNDSGVVDGGLVQRTRIDPHERRALFELYDPDETSDAEMGSPEWAAFVTPRATWLIEQPGRDFPPRRGETLWPEGKIGWSVDRAKLSEADWSVVRRNDSSVTVAFTGEPAVRAFGQVPGVDGSNRVAVTFSTDENPHLERVVVELREDSVLKRYVYTYSEVDATRVDGPERVPAYFERLHWRAERGFERIGSLLGL